ncbi:MAG: tetratricopeptide repeat protein [Pseudomonadota bacterium]
MRSFVINADALARFPYVIHPVLLPLFLAAFMVTAKATPIPNYVSKQQESVQRIPPKRSTDSQLFKSLQEAIFLKDYEEMADILVRLKGKETSKKLLILARKKLNAHSPEFDPRAGLELSKRVIATRSSYRGDAALLIGVHLKRSTSHTERVLAIDWLKKALLWGTNKAHSHLGDIYSARGNGTLDMNKALYHYKKTAHLVSTAPLVSFARKIARLNRRGEDCGIDPIALAKEYLPRLEAEATAGERLAAKELGRLYLKGIFVKQDFSIAENWLQLAAHKGDAGALRELALAKRIFPNHEAAPQVSKALLRRSADIGNAAAYANLAKLYLIKNDFESDTKAFRLYRKSVDAGYHIAITELKSVLKGEMLLGQNPSRIQRLSEAIATISAGTADHTNLSNEGAADQYVLEQWVDPTIVGSISTENTTGLQQQPATMRAREVCRYGEYLHLESKEFTID